MEEELLHGFGFFDPGEEIPRFDDHLVQLEEEDQRIRDSIKSRIASHPLYPALLSSYLLSQKVGAPPEIASLLEEISKEIHVRGKPTEIGADPQLDDFMESYTGVLNRYTQELSKPFDEATSYLSSIESQLSALCIQTLPSPAPGEEGSKGGGSEAELKDMLMRKYSGYLSTLKEEFMKKRKKGKLPKDATSALMDWWNANNAWPYPTEVDKKRLSEMTGLDQKQINNWFINQRKRHWRPSEEIKFALMEAGGSRYLDHS